MENTSVSKGIFVNKGNYKLNRKRNKHSIEANYPYPWYDTYKKAWSMVEIAAKKINTKMFEKALTDLSNFVLKIKLSDKKLKEIPTAALMTGVNLQDHDILFDQLLNKMQDITPFISMLSSANCNNLKQMMENTIDQFLKLNVNEEDGFKKYKTLYDLNEWCEANKKKTSNVPFLIMIPEFKSINPKVLSDFIHTLSIHSKHIKFILIFGVATTIQAVHTAFTFNIISKMRIEIFYMPSQLDQLNDIIGGTMLSVEMPFKLIGRIMILLSDIFYFNELSLNGYLRTYKTCMVHLFFNNNIQILSCKSNNFREQVEFLSMDDILKIKTYPSIIAELTKEEQRRGGRLKIDEFKDFLATIVKNFHDYMETFIIMLKCYHILVEGLPGYKSGTKLHQIYVKVVSQNFIEDPEFKEAMNLLKHLSKEELLKKLNDVISILNEYKTYVPDSIISTLNKHAKLIESANLEIVDNSPKVQMQNFKSRREMTKQLQINAQQKNESQFQIAKSKLISYLDQSIFSVYLKNPNEKPGYEIFYRNDINAVIKSYIVGSMKGAIHKAATNPHAYLKCSCCKIDDETTILPTMLDICIVYKLHLESIKLINMYDWLQSFLSIVNPSEMCEEQRDVNPKLRARFTQAVADLERLGYIKISKKKVDHVKRLVLI